MEDREELIIDVDKCARCGKNHSNLKFTRIYNLIRYTHWCMCPNVNQPILLEIVEKVEYWDKENNKWV